MATLRRLPLLALAVACASKGNIVGVDSATDSVSTSGSMSTMSTSVGDTVDGSTTELDTDTGASGDDECVVPPPGGTWPECPNTGGAGGWIDTIERSIVYDLPTASLCTVTAIEADGSYGYTLTFLCGGEEWQQYFGGVPRVPLEVGDEVFIEGDAWFSYPSVFFWLTIHRVGDGRLVVAALGDEMPAPEILASRWSPLGIELLDTLCPEVWLGDCGSVQDLSFRVSVGDDAVVVGAGEAKVGGQGNRYAIEIERAYHRPCYHPCGEENPTEYDLVAIFLDPAFKYP